MKRLFILLAVVFMTAPALAQKGTKLYKDLSEGMSIKEAKKMMKKNKDDYKEVSFGNGFMWTIKTTGLMSRKKGEDYLAGVWMWPKGSLLTGVGYDAARGYLDASASFFEERGYTDLIRNDWWNAPQMFNDGGYKYGLVLLSPDGARVVHMYPSEIPSMDGKTTNPQVYIKVFSKGHWDTMMTASADKKEKDTKDTDF
jgi:hypothetical protein